MYIHRRCGEKRNTGGGSSGSFSDWQKSSAHRYPVPLCYPEIWRFIRFPGRCTVERSVIKVGKRNAIRKTIVRYILLIH